MKWTHTRKRELYRAASDIGMQIHIAIAARRPHQSRTETHTMQKIQPTSIQAILCALLVAGCTSTQHQNPAAAAGPPAAPAAPSSPLGDAGFEAETATGTGLIVSVDKAHRQVVIKRQDGSTTGYTAGPEVVNFDQLSAGDEVVATVTESCAFFVVKGGLLPGAAGGSVVARAPKGSTPGGLALATRDYSATILDVDPLTRKVLLKYGPNDASSIKVGPNVDLTKLAVGDDVLVRATEAMAITVVKPQANSNPSSQ